MPIFEYGQVQTDHLKRRDKRLGEAIDRIGHISRTTTPDLFQALIGQIVSQQISTKAAQTVKARLCAELGTIDPRSIDSMHEDRIQRCGLSMRKVSYMKILAKSVLDGDIDLEALHLMPDDQVCARLSQIKGIGVWTAQMLMTFSMQRQDVISFDDLAIQRALRMLYRHRRITRELFEKYRRRYSPYASTASLYLWEVAGGALLELTDPAPSADAKRKAKGAERAAIEKREGRLIIREGAAAEKLNITN